MKKGYIIAHVHVRDLEGFDSYLQKGLPALDEFGGRAIVLGGDHEVMEGQKRERHVIIEFDSYKQALKCYNSAAYQDAADLRKQYADTDLVVVEGL